MNDCKALFVTSTGGPMTFFLELSLCKAEVERLEKRILVHGGFTVKKVTSMDQFTIHLVDENSVSLTPLNSPTFFYKFVDDCVERNQLLTLKDYLACNNPSFAAMNFQRVIFEKAEPMRRARISDLCARLITSRSRKMLLTVAPIEIVDTTYCQPIEDEAVARAVCRKPLRSWSSLVMEEEANHSPSPHAPLGETEIQIPTEQVENDENMGESNLVVADPSTTDVDPLSLDAENQGRLVIVTDEEDVAAPSNPPDPPNQSKTTKRSITQLSSRNNSTSSTTRTVVTRGTPNPTRSQKDRIIDELEPLTSRRARRPNFKTREAYSIQEKRDMLNYLLSLPRDSTFLRGNRVWKDMEDMKVCPTRSYQSLKNHFLKTVIKDLDKFTFLSYNDKKWLKSKIS